MKRTFAVFLFINVLFVTSVSSQQLRTDTTIVFINKDTCRFIIPVRTGPENFARPFYDGNLNACNCSSFNFKIYDPWGNVLFEANDPAQLAEYNDLNGGEYVWVLAIRTRVASEEKKYLWSGKMTVVR